jgi:hypothetical protein
VKNILMALICIFCIKTFKNPVVYISLVLVGGAYIVKNNDEEYVQPLKEFGQDVLDKLEPRKSFNTAKEFFINPDAMFRSAVQISKNIGRDFSWLAKFKKKAAIVTGITGDGKTTFLLSLVRDYIESGGNHLRISDIDYLMSHEGSEPNDWFGLPETEFISTTYETILADLRKFSKLFDDRIKEQRKDTQASKKWSWALHVVDEFPGFIAEAKDRGDLDEVVSIFKKLLNRGLKARIRCAYGAQNLSFADTGISLSAQESFNICLLGSAALNENYLERLGVKNSKKRSELIAQVKGLRDQGLYVAIVRIEQIISVEILPDLSDVGNFRYVDPFAKWVNSLTEDTITYITEFAKTYTLGDDLKGLYDFTLADSREKQSYILQILENSVTVGDEDEKWWLKTFTDDVKTSWSEAKSKKGKSQLRSEMLKIFKTHEMKKSNPRYVIARREWDNFS